MVDREIIKQNPDTVRQMLSGRGDEPALVDRFLDADKKWRAKLGQFEQLKAKQNARSRSGKPSASELAAAKKDKAELQRLSAEVVKLETEMTEAWLAIPNFVADDVPVGPGDTANAVITQVGPVRTSAGLTHEQLMTVGAPTKANLNLKAAATFSGSRFRYLLNQAASAHLSLLHDAFRLAVKTGFTPVIPPVLTRYETLQGAGFFPAAKADIFKIEGENLYLTGTSEQTMLALAADQVINEADLPIRLVGFSSCFRKEAGSYGKDVEGMFRQHQFDKVELVSITLPEQSASEHEFLVGLERRFVERYRLPYQVVAIGSGDLGATAAKKIDIETWFPGQQRYRETHSASNCTDYQARRLRIKIKRSDGSEVLAHTLNATLATERLLLAIIENNQRPDGSFRLPRRLRS